MKVSACRGCGAKIIWIITPAGRRMPLDFEPVGNALWVIDPNNEGAESPRAFPAAPRKSHFASCPHADAFRKGEVPG